jgi:hypothetical protein
MTKSNRGLPPVPWKNKNGYIVDAEGVLVARVKGRDTDYDRREMNADAELIVRAVNNHARLLAFCKAIVADATPADRWQDMIVDASVVDRARQAITDAEAPNEIDHEKN